MSDRKYEVLVWSLQAKADKQPALFRSQVFFISICAYVALVAILALVGALAWWWATARTHITARTWLMIAGALFTLLPMCYLFLRMFLRRIPPPGGRVLTQIEAPQLFNALKQLQQRFKGPPIKQVLIVPEFTAAIAQVPRFGLFGGHSNYLILGLPFLFGMSPREMLSVIAHEYGHLAGGHGKMGAWIYRQRRTFATLHRHVHERRDDDVLSDFLARAFDHLTPYYNAYTFVLSRQQEYQADAVAATFAGPEQIASALVRVHLLGAWVAHEFWPRLYDQAEGSPEPSYLPYTAMRKVLTITHADWATDEALKRVWAEESGVHDTHPCLRERLDALNQKQRLPAPVERSAAEAILGDLAITIAREFDGAWWQAERGAWQERYRYRTESMRRLQALLPRPLAELDVVEIQELGTLLLEFRSADVAKPVFEYLLARPGKRYPKPLYIYGRILLQEGQSAGLTKLEEAVQLSPSMLDDCAREGYRWLLETRGEAAADDWVERLYAAAAD